MQYGILHFMVAVLGLCSHRIWTNGRSLPGGSRRNSPCHPKFVRRSSDEAAAKMSIRRQCDAIMKSFNNVATASSQQAFGTIEMAKGGNSSLSMDLQIINTSFFCAVSLHA